MLEFFTHYAPNTYIWLTCNSSCCFGQCIYVRANYYCCQTFNLWLALVVITTGQTKIWTTKQLRENLLCSIIPLNWILCKEMKHKENLGKVNYMLLNITTYQRIFQVKPYRQITSVIQFNQKYLDLSDYDDIVIPLTHLLNCIYKCLSLWYGKNNLIKF